jgi:alkylation response protein AidB-like acyl-CoA dehydrogenase
MFSQHRTIELSLAEQAGWLNEGVSWCSVTSSLDMLSSSGRLGHGVPESLGGSGGTLLSAVEEIAIVSEQCLTSGFVFWCQRTFIEYLISSSNRWLILQVLPKILRAECSGATVIEDVVSAAPVSALLEGDTVTLEGFLPWVSNLQPKNFFVVVTAKTNDGKTLIVAVPSGAKGIQRGDDLQLLGLQASWTSTLHLNKVCLSRQWIISENADLFLSQIRPKLILMQCALSLGITRRSLQETLQSTDGDNQEALINRLRYNFFTLTQLETQIWKLGTLQNFNSSKREILELRVALTRSALDSVWLELEAKGMNAYLKPSGTARRLREVAFLPVMAPTLLQLEQELQKAGNTLYGLGTSAFK